MRISVWLTRTVDISTLKGLRQAERLQAKGYKFNMAGIDKLIFWIPNPKAIKAMEKTK